MKAKIASIAYHLPDRLVTSAEIEDALRENNPSLRITPGIIESTTGIRGRYFAASDEYNSHLAKHAAQKALASAGIEPNDIDLLIFASAGQDLLEPATGHIVQDMLGTKVPVFDVKNACNSFINALEVANAFICAGTYQNILIATGESGSRSIKWKLEDRDDLKRSFAGYTLGDAGAAAVITQSQDDSYIMSHRGTADSSQWQTGMFPGGGSRHPRGDEYTYFQGNGAALKEAFEHIGPDFVARFLLDNNISPEQIDRVYMHQVSTAYLESFIGRTGISERVVEHTIETFGNVAAATIPIGICRSLERDALHRGNTVLLLGMAGGISIEAMLMRW